MLMLTATLALVAASYVSGASVDASVDAGNLESVHIVAPEGYVPQENGMLELDAGLFPIGFLGRVKEGDTMVPAADAHRKRNACPNTDLPTEFVRTKLWHKDEMCNGEADPYVVIEEPFNYCLTQDGRTYYQFEYEVDASTGVDTTKFRRCIYAAPVDRFGSNGVKKQNDECCTQASAKTCTDAPRPLKSCFQAIMDLSGGGSQPSSEQVISRAQVEVGPQATLAKLPGQPKKTLVRKQYTSDDCKGTAKEEEITGCHEITVNTHMTEGYAFFANMYEGNAQSITQARYCIYYEFLCNQMNQRPPYLCRLFPKLDTCQSDGNGFSHTVAVVDTASLPPPGSDGGAVTQQRSMSVATVFFVAIMAMAFAALF